MKLSKIEKVIEVKSGIERGEKWQWKTPALSYWVDFDNWFEWEADLSKYEFRIKPNPTLRPWRPEEVPVGAVIKTKDTTIFSRLMIVFVTNRPDEATLSTRAAQWDKMIGMNVSMKGLLEIYEHSIDGGKTWKPCGIIEE